ncbi:MAG: hypothetical protein CMH15_10695 [Mesonia sp.]|nr:hypothetical protein [Mesonia sp.]
MDNRMLVYNNSSDDIFVRMIFINKDVKETMVGLRKIKSKSKERIGKLYSWESEFEDSSDSILSVVIFSDYVFLDNKYEASNKNKSDSLLKLGDYQVHHYKYSDLENNDWVIKYPEDGFKKGKKLFTENNNRKKPTPNPKVLKEKEIEDRWND